MAVSALSALHIYLSSVCKHSATSLPQLMIPHEKRGLQTLGLESLPIELFLYRINRSTLLVSSLSLEAKDAVNLSKQGIISADSDIHAGMNLRPALSVKNISSLHELSVSPLRA